MRGYNRQALSAEADGRGSETYRREIKSKLSSSHHAPATSQKSHTAILTNSTNKTKIIYEH